MRRKNIFLNQIRRFRRGGIKTYQYNSAKYHEAQMASNEANTLDWDNFKSRMNPIGVVPIGESLECIGISNYTPWAPQDVSLFVGGNSREICQISDLNEKEGASFFELNFYLAKNILQDGNNRKVSVSIGFNPNDFSLGHHSVKRLHSHIYVSDSDYIDKSLQKTSWRDLEKADKLMLVEPTAIIFYDKIKDNCVKKGFWKMEPIDRLGYIELRFEPNIDASKLFSFIRGVYDLCSSEYEKVAKVFSGDPADKNGRFIPYEQGERVIFLKKYLQENKELSNESKNVLTTLAENITFAEEKNELSQVNSNQTIWITKGFAGVFSFVFGRQDELKVYFLPRVITTSGVEKVIFGENRPTRVKRDTKIRIASEQERTIMQEYLHTVQELLMNY